MVTVKKFYILTKLGDYYGIDSTIITNVKKKLLFKMKDG